MRRRMALIVVCALAVIGSVLGHGQVISGMRLKADVQPVRIPVADKPANQAAPAMKTVEFRGYAFKVPADWPVYQLSKDPSQCVRYDVNAVYLGTPGPNQHCPPDLVGTSDTVTVGGPAIPGVLVVSSAANRRAQVGDLRSGTDLPAAPGTIMQNPGQHEFAISMPTHAPSFTATYGTDPGLIMQVFGSLHAVTSQFGHPSGPLQPRGGPTHPTNWGFPSPVTGTTRPHIVPSVVYSPPDNDPSPLALADPRTHQDHARAAPDDPPTGGDDPGTDAGTRLDRRRPSPHRRGPTRRRRRRARRRSSRGPGSAPPWPGSTPAPPRRWRP